MQTPGFKQTYTLHRVVFAADTPSALTKRDEGVNMGGYRIARIQSIPINTREPPKKLGDWPGVVVVDATSNPSIDVYFWCAPLGRFIFHKSLVGSAGKPQEWDVEVNERIMLLALANDSAADKAVAILVAGQHYVEIP